MMALKSSSCLGRRCRLLVQLLLLPLLVQRRCAAAAPAEKSEECASPRTLRRLPRAPSVAEFRDLWRRDGAVLFETGPSSQLVRDAFVKFNRYMGDLNLTLSSMVDKDETVTCNAKNRTGGVSPLRLQMKTHHVLAPADGTVQGPHMEGAASDRGNRRALAFVCQEPGLEGGATAIFDMQRAWEILPADIKDRLRRSNFGFQQLVGDTHVVPSVVNHDVTGEPCLQFYCFGRLARDCADVYRSKTGRYNVTPEHYLYEMHPEKDLLLIGEDGETVPFLGVDLYYLLDSIYDTMVEVTWKKGDVLLLDNVRWAHARLEGSGRKRQVHFFTFGHRGGGFDLMNFSRPP